ncbi:MAG: polymer-forming cytoskeletal protein [Oligoflexia bacterium]|nr:polymer-forming cytoskeletal protein [Oligoflexia bacterium]
MNREYYSRVSENVSAIIEAGCEFEGKLAFEGIVRLGGKFDGEIFTNDVLIIEETAFVKANIDAEVVIISGKVVGNIVARSRIEIFKPAMVKGNLTAPIIVMEEGVVFEGKTKMGE